MEENTMKCPFRQDEHGEFEECYGKRCMAYYEITTLNSCQAGNSTNSFRMCRRITPTLQQYPSTTYLSGNSLTLSAPYQGCTPINCVQNGGTYGKD